MFYLLQPRSCSKAGAAEDNVPNVPTASWLCPCPGEEKRSASKLLKNNSTLKGENFPLLLRYHAWSCQKSPGADEQLRTSPGIQGHCW